MKRHFTQHWFIRRAAVLFLFLLLLAGLLVFPVRAQVDEVIRVGPSTFSEGILSYAADQLIVKFKQDASVPAIEQLKAAHGAQESRVSAFGGFLTLSLPAGSDVEVIADAFKRSPLVEYAHPNFFAQAHMVPNDPLYCLQWHFDDSLERDLDISPGVACQASSGNPFGGTNGGGIGMESAWDTTTGSATVIVAILDTGVAYEDFSDPNDAGCYDLFGEVKKCRGKAIDTYTQAPDLANTTFTILAGSDLVNSDDHPNDDNSHGSHVTGTVAQSTNNGLGVAGMAFDTTIMPVKILDADGSGLFSVIADGIYFATNNGADVINMSLGGTANVQVMEDAVAYAFNNGVTVVASAGNSFTSGNPVNYPAAYDAYVIAVGATRYDETRAPYSSTGSYVDIAAPGGDTGVDQNGDGFADGVLQQTFGDNSDTSDFAYWFFQGTSMAAPHVTALSALLLAVDNTLTPTQVRSALESTAEDKGTTGRDDEYGHGIIDAPAALASVASTVSISITTDGAVDFGILAPGDTLDTTASGTNDVQTVSVDVGPADLDVRSGSFSDGSNIWALGATNGADQVQWEFLGDGASWTTLAQENTLYSLSTSTAQGSTQDVSFRFTMPTTTSSTDTHNATVTIVATAP